MTTTVELASLRSILIGSTKRNIPLGAEVDSQSISYRLQAVEVMKYIFDHPVPLILIRNSHGNESHHKIIGCKSCQKKERTPGTVNTNRRQRVTVRGFPKATTQLPSFST